MKKIDPDKLAVLMDVFNKEIGYKYKSLHAAFEDCRTNNIEHYKVLSELYKNVPGKEYLKSFYKSKNNSKIIKHNPQK